MSRFRMFADKPNPKDEVITTLRSHIAMMDHNLAEMRRQYDDLIDRYHILAQPPVSLSTGTADLAPRVKSLVVQAIRDESAGDSRLAAFLARRAKELKADGKTETEIEAELRHWQSSEDEGFTG